MINISKSDYRNAFNAYLRTGAPIERNLQALLQKQDYPTTHYVWRTRSDDKVRSSHAANNGKIFAWDNPPETGHPAEDYGCRCVAEPVQFIAGQSIITSINDNPVKWSNYNFLYYYRNGDGSRVTLEQIGYLRSIINYYFYDLGTYERLNLQIINTALVSSKNNFTYNFERSYDFGGIFTGVKYSFGDAVVEGKFDGSYSIQQNSIVINGIISYVFSDNFSDVTSKIEELMEEENITREEAISRLGDSADEYGTPYKIIGRWQTEFNAIIEPK